MENLVRIICFGVLSCFLALTLAPAYIRILHKLRLSKKIREEASVLGGKASIFNKLHIHKQGTPTMGGGMIIISVILMVLLSMMLVALGKEIGLDLTNSLWNRNETYLVVFTLITIGLLGAVDDYMNIRGIGKTKGMSARVKILGLTFFAFLGASWFYLKLGYDSVSLPFIGSISIGWWYVPLFIFIIIAMTNAVNMTDGLDGLAGGLMLQNFFLYAFITYQESLFLLSTLCVVIVGTLIGFLWFNIKPAQFIMGDVGSLSLGATLGVMAMMTDTLVVLFIAALIYVWEILSVIIQLTSKRLRNGKKVFKIAPYHHHLEAHGWTEENIVMRLWLLGGLLNAIAMVVYVMI